MRRRNVLLIFNEFVVEPILLAFGIFIIFPHFQTVYNNTMPYKIHIKDTPTFINGMWKDMNMYPTPYIIFGIIFVIWVSLKAYRFWSDRKTENELKKSIDELPQNIAEALKIDELPRKIAEALKPSSDISKRGKDNV